MSRMEVTAFYNLISVATSHHFYHNLFIGSKSLGPASPQWRARDHTVSVMRGLNDKGNRVSDLRKIIYY